MTQYEPGSLHQVGLTAIAYELTLKSASALVQIWGV